MLRWLNRNSVKGKEMAKNSPVQDAINLSKSDQGQSSTEPNYTRFMVGTYLDPQHGWMICQAAFDPVTKQVGEMTSEKASGDREVMIERLQIKVVNLGLMQPEVIKAEKKEDIY